MSDLQTNSSWVLGAIPVVGGLLGWLILWRRNTILCSITTVHFCGEELKEKGFWAENKEAKPLIDAKLIRFQNFGLKHLPSFEIVSHNVSPDFIFHPNHGNSLPVTNFSYEYNAGLLKIIVKEIPAFEKFSVALLNTDSKRAFRPVGSGISYVIKSRRTYIRQMILRSIATLVLIGAIIYYVYR